MTTVLRSAYVWTSLILVLAVLGATMALASRAGSRGKPLPAVLAAAALLAPAGQAVLHTTVSLHKHVVPGAWFAAIAAGYAMARLSRVDPGHGWAAVMALPIAAATLFGSLGQAAALFRVWPDSAAAVAVLRSAVRAHPGQYLAEDYDVEAYYLRDRVPWPRWSNTWFFRYRQAAPGPPSYAAAISHHYFSLVILDFGDTAATDVLITADMRRAGGYYVLARAGPFTIWASRAPAPAGVTVAVTEPRPPRQASPLPRRRRGLPAQAAGRPGKVQVLRPATPLGLLLAAGGLGRRPVRVHQGGRTGLAHRPGHVAAAHGHGAAGGGQLLAARRAAPALPWPPTGPAWPATGPKQPESPRARRWTCSCPAAASRWPCWTTPSGT